mmetsp:Transcript_85455/g.276727  ORF Transcript_85455/g.276727 Transcript_85455/m.276727 type:complete len:275 (-) Transcript_85455:1284-2108(-)
MAVAASQLAHAERSAARPPAGEQENCHFCRCRSRAFCAQRPWLGAALARQQGFEDCSGVQGSGLASSAGPRRTAAGPSLGLRQESDLACSEQPRAPREPAAPQRVLRPGTPGPREGLEALLSPLPQLLLQLCRRGLELLPRHAERRLSGGFGIGAEVEDPPRASIPASRLLKASQAASAVSVQLQARAEVLRPAHIGRRRPGRLQLLLKEEQKAPARLKRARCLLQQLRHEVGVLKAWALPCWGLQLLARVHEVLLGQSSTGPHATGDGSSSTL